MDENRRNRIHIGAITEIGKLNDEGFCPEKHHGGI
jgi:hypothetical protein